MSQDTKPSPSPPAAKQAETLEDAVYRPSLSEDNKALRGTNPMVAIPTALLTYGCVAALIFYVATQTEAGKQVVKKTIGIDISEDSSKEKEEEPPPPPPAPAAPAAPPVKIEIKDAPPPPPITGQ
ncbi:MAG: hypothetical protein LBH03_05305, partial [Holophagales bacterium]|nr:hypothetical protein [Holophagales bacterium]